PLRRANHLPHALPQHPDVSPAQNPKPPHPRRPVEPLHPLRHQLPTKKDDRTRTSPRLLRPERPPLQRFLHPLSPGSFQHQLSPRQNSSSLMNAARFFQLTLRNQGRDGADNAQSYRGFASTAEGVCSSCTTFALLQGVRTCTAKVG